MYLNFFACFVRLSVIMTVSHASCHMKKRSYFACILSLIAGRSFTFFTELSIISRFFLVCDPKKPRSASNTGSKSKGSSNQVVSQQTLNHKLIAIFYVVWERMQKVYGIH